MLRIVFTAICILLHTISFHAFSEENLLRQADLHYANREDPQELAVALEKYRELASSTPPLFEAAWKLSKAYWYRGNFLEYENKKQYFEKGMEAGKTAVAISPERCEGHFWFGVNTALYADSSGMFKALGLVDDVKQSMQTAIQIDENCECGGPQRVLGQLYARLPFFKGGSTSKAIEYLKRSLELCPNDTQSRIFLAEIYLDEDEQGLAIQQLKLVLRETPDPEWIPETKQNKIVAASMLKKLDRRR